jgi:hypothetical protein
MSLRDFRKRQAASAAETRRGSKYWETSTVAKTHPLQGREMAGTEKGRSSGALAVEKPGR